MLAAEGQRKGFAGGIGLASDGPIALDAAGRVLSTTVSAESPSVLPRALLERRQFADGSLDATFGHGGRFVTPIRGRWIEYSGQYVEISALRAMPDAGILLGADGVLFLLLPDGA